MGGLTERAAQILDRAHRQTATVDESGTTYVNTYQDVEPHLRYAHAKRRLEAETRGKFGRRPDLHHVASWPFNIILKAAEKLGISAGEIFWKEHSKRLSKELRRPEYKLFRTTNDKLI